MWGDGRSQSGCTRCGSGVIVPISTMDLSICNLVVVKTDFSLMIIKVCSLAGFLNLFQHWSWLPWSAAQIYTLSRNANVFSKSLVEKIVPFFCGNN